MATVTDRVDTWEMVFVHRMLRREFRLAPRMVRSVAEGDTAQAAVVGGFFDQLAKVLRHHHAGEDELLWPLLVPRVGELDAARVRHTMAAHEHVAGLLDRVEVLLPRWWHTADRETRDQLADVITRASAALDEHLTEEETEVLPLVSRHLTPAEWAALGRYARKGFPKNAAALVFIGALLEDAPPAEQAAFLESLPAPTRLAWQVAGRGVHRRAMHRLRGGAWRGRG
jgi:hemerythrin-like domain-containing protein